MSGRSHDRDREREWYQRNDDSRYYQDDDRYGGSSSSRNHHHQSSSHHQDGDDYYRHSSSSDQYHSRSDRSSHHLTSHRSRSRHDRSRSRSPAKRREHAERDSSHRDYESSSRDYERGGGDRHSAGRSHYGGTTSNADSQEGYQEGGNYDGYDYDSNNSQEQWYASRDGSGQQNNQHWDTPNKTLMFKGLATWIEEHDVMAKLAEGHFQAKEVRLMRRRETGESRGFAFVEFETLDEASQYMEYTQGSIDFGRGSLPVAVIYSLPKEGINSVALQRNDWMCAKCGVNNFRRRDACFKCGVSKEECQAPEMIEEISLQPTNTLLLRNLTNLTTEEKVLSTLAGLTALPIRSCKVLRDPIYGLSRGVCAVELHSTSEASQLFTMLSSCNPVFSIDNNEVALNYGRKPPMQMPGSLPLGGMMMGPSGMPVSTSGGTLYHQTKNSAASAALAAAQWTNQSNNAGNSSSVSHVTVNGVQYKVFPPPDTSKYQHEPTSGYYYDPSTGFYYDANTHYYYNPTTLKYCYWDAAHSTYLPAPDGSDTSEAAPKDNSKKAAQDASGRNAGDKAKSDKKDSKKSNKTDESDTATTEGGDKVKVARKVAKDMERWARALNQKKEPAAKFQPAFIETEPADSSASPPTSTSSGSRLTSGGGIDTSKSNNKNNNPFAGKINSFVVGGSLSSVPKAPNNSIVEAINATDPAHSSQRLASDNPVQSSSPSPPPAPPTRHQSDTATHDDDSPGLTPTGNSRTRSADIEVMIAGELEQRISWDTLACLLCKRKFASKEQLEKHAAMSDLHKTNVSTLRTTLLEKYGLDESQLSRPSVGTTQESEASSLSSSTKISSSSTPYRDRAKERRLKYGQPEHPADADYGPASGGASGGSAVTHERVEFSSASCSVGSKMMKAMGWEEGKGLGRRGAAATQVIQVEQRGQQVGLGYKDSATVAPRAGEKYKDAVKRAMAQRFKELQ